MIELTRAQNVQLMAMVGAPTPGAAVQSSSMRLARSQASFAQSQLAELGSSFSSSSSSSSSPLLPPPPPMQPLDGVELSAGAKALVRRHAHLLSGVIGSSSGFNIESPSSSSTTSQHPHTMRVSPVSHMLSTSSTNTADAEYYNDGGGEGGGNDSLNESSFLRVSNEDGGANQPGALSSRSRQQQQQHQSAQRVPGVRPTSSYAANSGGSSSSSSSHPQRGSMSSSSSSARNGSSNNSNGNLVSVSHAAAVASASAVAVDTNRNNNNNMRDGGGSNGSGGSSSSGGGGGGLPTTNNDPPSRPEVRAAPYDMIPAANEQRSVAPSSSSSTSSTSSMTAPQFFKLLKARVSPSNLETLMASLSVFNQGSISKGELLSIAERTLAPDPLRLTVAPDVAAKFSQAELTADLTEVFKRLILRSAS